MNTQINEKKFVSVVLSFRNEEEVIPELLSRLHEVLKLLPIEYELIFVNDASIDNSLALLMEKAKEDNRVKIINTSRRFGVSECALAGMKYARGDAVIYMDADLQDPPEVIPQLIEEWLQGADVVYTIRTSRKGESAFKMLLTKIAYRFIRCSSPDVDLPVNAGDFRLISRRVVNELTKLNEKAPYLRGLVSWVGFKQVPVFYERQKRAAGKMHFPVFQSWFRDLLTLHGPVGTAIRGVTSFSVLPLMLFLLSGLVICVAAIVALIVLAAVSALEAPWAIIIAVFFLAGVQLVGIGTLGLYLGRVYNDVRNRPNHIIESTIGFEQDEQS